jgi:hypothetical protein
MVNKIFNILLLCLFVQIATAQNAATPNPGFENWTQVNNYYNPNGWNNLNGNTAILGVFTCTRVSAAADVHSGTYAKKLTTKSVFGITANGISSTATLVTSPPYGVTGGIPFALRPDSIVGWYKYNPASAADSGFVQFVLLGATNDTIGFVKFNTPHTAVTTYTRFSRPINYFSSSTPTLSYWIVSASDGVNPVVNSNIIVDDFDLIFNPSGVGIPESNLADQVQLNSNFTSNFLTVSNQSFKNIVLTIFDNTGKKVISKNLVNGVSEIDIQKLKSGVYFYNFMQQGTNAVKNGKFVKM